MNNQVPQPCPNLNEHGKDLPRIQRQGYKFPVKQCQYCGWVDTEDIESKILLQQNTQRAEQLRERLAEVVDRIEGSECHGSIPLDPVQELLDIFSSELSNVEKKFELIINEVIGQDEEMYTRLDNTELLDNSKWWGNKVRAEQRKRAKALLHRLEDTNE